ncbi:MAG TPA: energy transducer TonB [Verrucomicrobiae bacterium]|nr:energy transducer TonB [Verrucomicrobiae bacterium]
MPTHRKPPRWHRAALLAAACVLALGAAPPLPAPKTSQGVVTVPSKFVGYEPDSLALRLVDIDSADVARACGNICAPWAYRGPLGRDQSMRSYGKRHVDGAQARALANYLLRWNQVDTASKVPSTTVPCEPAAAKPVYLVSFHGPGEDTFALLRFDIGAALFFDVEDPLGMVTMGADGDSLWASLGTLLDNDPLLRRERPRPPPGMTADALKGDFALVDTLPEVTKRVRPTYPSVARVMELSGVVVIQALVGKDGAVKDAFVITGHPVFRDDAIEAIWQWHFKPAVYHGDPVAVWVAIPVRFTLLQQE